MDNLHIYLVSVPSNRDFHIWCKEMGKRPGTEALFIPTAPPSRRVVALRDKHVATDAFLIGTFSQEERDALLPQKQEVAAAPAKKDKRNAESQADPAGA